MDELWAIQRGRGQEQQALEEVALDLPVLFGHEVLLKSDLEIFLVFIMIEKERDGIDQESA